MTIKKITPRLKNNFLKLCTISSLLLIGSCTETETLSDTDLVSTGENRLSSNSIELSVLNITADEEQSANPASNAIDDDPESRWSGFGNSINLDLDLGSVNLVDYINVSFYKGDERTNSFQVFTSNDGSDWTLRNTKISTGNTESLETFDLSNTDTRYVRLRCSGNSLNDWNSILDIEVYGTPSDDSGSAGATYIAVPSKIEAEDYSVATEGRTQVQGNVTNVGWIDDGESLSYNINVPSSGTYDIDFRVASRNQGTSFDIYQGNSRLDIVFSDATGGWATWETISTTVELSAGNQTLEVVATGTGWNIDWLEIKASDDNGNNGPIDTPPTGGTVEDIIGDFWKITMPVDEDGNGSPRSCSEYDCRNNDAIDVYGLNEAAANSGYSDYFYEDNGWVVFKAFCGGATTENSQYPRCELRGLDSTGDDNYFDMDDYQELNVTVKVLSVPVERPEVNMVQIHGPDDEPLRVEYNDGSTGSDQGLHITYNENNTWDDVMDYEIGDELKVRVVVENGRISFWLDNLTNGDSYNNDFSSSDDTGYFKVGCYLQSSITYCDVKSGDSFCRNGGQSDDYDATGSVAVKDLTLIRDGQTYK